MRYESRVLLLCIDPLIRSDMAESLKKSGVVPLLSASTQEAQTLLSYRSVIAVFCEDLLMRGFCDQLSKITNAPLVVISRAGGRAEYLESVIVGAFEFIALPARLDEVHAVVRRALRAKKHASLTA
jgi:DNA-binding NtrC family response regulator